MPNRHRIKILPSREYLLACFDYDLTTGALTWKRRPREHFQSEKAWRGRNNRFAAKPAGCPAERGYYTVGVARHRYLIHRLIWKWMTGDDPPVSPDHINGDPSDNRWINLRLATQQQQTWNTTLRKTNTSGFRGVRQQASGKYGTRIHIAGEQRWLGLFDTPEEASAVYEAAARQLRGEFYRP